MAGPANVGINTRGVGRMGAVSVSVSVGVAEGSSVGVSVGGSVNVGVAVRGKANVGVPVAGKIACVPGKPHENKNRPSTTNSRMNSFLDFILHHLNRTGHSNITPSVALAGASLSIVILLTSKMHGRCSFFLN